MPIHLRAEPGDYAPNVLCPGDPRRARYIAETFFDPGFQVVNEPPTIERLAAALNALGVSTREAMAIFQTLKRAGALQAELVIN